MKIFGMLRTLRVSQKHVEVRVIDSGYENVEFILFVLRSSRAEINRGRRAEDRGKSARSS